MPKVVLPGSTPATAGGTGKGKWIDVTDATLRSNLGSGEADLGGALVSIDNATVRELAENNIFRKMTRADINTMLNTLVPRSMLNTLCRPFRMKVIRALCFHMM